MNIKKAERVKQLTGMKVGRACPAISHLLFVDDSLFFCKANKEECQTIHRILKEYGAVLESRGKYKKHALKIMGQIMYK